MSRKETVYRIWYSSKMNKSTNSKMWSGQKLNIWNFSQTKPLNILGPFWGTCMRGLSFTTALVGKNIHCKSGTDCMRYLHARTATRQECWGLCFDQRGWGGCSHWVCILDISISISTICKKCPNVTEIRKWKFFIIFQYCKLRHSLEPQILLHF